MKKKEFIGKTINNLNVIAPVDSFVCRCTECGELKIYQKGDLIAGTARCSCKDNIIPEDTKDNKDTITVSLEDTKQKSHYPLMDINDFYPETINNEYTNDNNEVKEEPKKRKSRYNPDNDKYIGKKYNMLTILKKDPNDKAKYICLCDCGNKKSLRLANITKNNQPTKSCGCLLQSKRKNNTNKESTETISSVNIKIDDVFGDLTIIKIGIKNKEGVQYYTCKCSCGTITSVSETDLLSGKKYNCGCQNRDLSGRRVGKLTIKEKDPNDKTKYICKCDCGNIRSVKAVSLLARKITSCGCSSRGRKPAGYQKRYGRLVIEDKYLNDSNIWIYRCKCDCGNTIETSEGNLEHGITTSCGKC